MRIRYYHIVIISNIGGQPKGAKWRNIRMDANGFTMNTRRALMQYFPLLTHVNCYDARTGAYIKQVRRADIWP